MKIQPPDRRHAGARRALPALLLVALFLGGGAAILPHDVFWHSDEGAKFLQVVNLRLSPDGLAGAIRYPGRTIDPGLQFVPFHPKQYRADATGTIYLQWPIFFALLTWPFYTLLGLGGLTALPWAAALAACWLSYRLARAIGAPPAWAWAAVPILGLGTPLGFYSGVFFEHTLAAALVAGAALLLLRGLASGAWQPLAGAGATLAAAIYLRSELYVLALAGAVLVGGAALAAGARGRRPEARRLGRAAVTVAIGLVLALLPLWAYYMVSEGDLLPQHALWYFEGAAPSGDAAPAGLQVPALRYLAQAGLGVIPDFLAGPAVPDAPSIPPSTIAALIGGTLAVLAAAVPLRRARRPAAPPNAAPAWALGLAVVGIALLAVAAASVLLSPQDYTSLHGFVLAAPIVVCAVFAVGPGAAPPAARRLAALTGLYVLFHLIVISALSGLGPISRYEWGQRYLLPAYPLLVALAVAGLARLAAWARPTARPDVAVAATSRLLARLALAGAARAGADRGGLPRPRLEHAGGRQGRGRKLGACRGGRARSGRAHRPLVAAAGARAAVLRAHLAAGLRPGGRGRLAGASRAVRRGGLQHGRLRAGPGGDAGGRPARGARRPAQPPRGGPDDPARDRVSGRSAPTR